MTQESSAAPDPAKELGERSTSHSLRLTLLVVLSVLLLASVAAVVYLAATRPVSALGIDGDQDALQRERDSVMAQSEQFMLRINTYGPDLLEGDTMPKYRELVEQVITPKFAADFEKNAPIAEATVKQAGLARTAEVFSTGVSAIDSDSATALVAGSITQSYPKSPGSEERVQTDPAPFRVQVTLVKVKGTWLVDDFTPLTGTDEGGTDGSTESPAATRRRPDRGGHAVTPTWYDLLGVEPDASEDEIRAAWKAAIADLEPTDRRFKTLNEAAEVLLDGERRAAYDAGLEPEADEPTDVAPRRSGETEPQQEAPEETQEEQDSRTTSATARSPPGCSPPLPC